MMMSWMRDNENNFPVKTAEEVTLNNKDMNAVEQESTMPDTIDKSYNGNTCASLGKFCFPSRIVPELIKGRYYFSKYVIDPNRFRFKKVVRILGLVLLFINNLCKKHKGKSSVNYRNPSVKFPGGMSCLGKAMGGQYILTTGSACKKSL